MWNLDIDCNKFNLRPCYKPESFSLRADNGRGLILMAISRLNILYFNHIDQCSDFLMLIVKKRKNCEYFFFLNLTHCLPSM